MRSVFFMCVMGCTSERATPVVVPSATVVDAGVADVPKLDKSPPADAQRDRAIKARFGERCRLERTCGALWGIDCEAAVDGPYYYVRPQADGLHEITVCGGACMGGRCTNCPPKNEGWTCETY